MAQSSLGILDFLAIEQYLFQFLIANQQAKFRFLIFSKNLMLFYNNSNILKDQPSYKETYLFHKVNFLQFFFIIELVQKIAITQPVLIHL